MVHVWCTISVIQVHLPFDFLVFCMELIYSDSSNRKNKSLLAAQKWTNNFLWTCVTQRIQLWWVFPGKPIPVHKLKKKKILYTDFWSILQNLLWVQMNFYKKKISDDSNLQMSKAMWQVPLMNYQRTSFVSHPGFSITESTSFRAPRVKVVS